MTTGTVSIIAPHGARISAHHEILAQPGVYVRSSHNILIGGGHIHGTLPVTVFPEPGIISPPPVTVSGVRTGGSGIHREGIAPLFYEINYSANDMAWEMRAEFPLDCEIQSITVTLGGNDLTFDVIHNQTDIDYQRQIQTIRAVYSLAKFLSQPYCLDDAFLYGSAKSLIKDILTGHSVSFEAADFIIGPELYLGLSTHQTRNQLLREVLELASGDMILQPSGGILIRDIAPGGHGNIPMITNPILSISQETPSPVPVAGVYVSIYGQHGGPSMDIQVIDESTGLIPKHKVKIYAWPQRPELSGKSQTPGSPIFDIDGVFAGSEETEEIVNFRNGRANVRPELSEIVRLERNPFTGQVTRSVLPAISVSEWLGPPLGSVSHHPDGTLRASVPGNSSARMTIRRKYYYVIVRPGSSIGGPLPAGHDFSRYPEDEIQIQFTLTMPGSSPAGMALIRTGDDGKTSDEVVIAPDNTLIAHAGQRFLRQANAQIMEIEVAGEAMSNIGQIINIGYGKMIVDSARLAVAGGRTTTRMEGRLLN